MPPTCPSASVAGLPFPARNGAAAQYFAQDVAPFGSDRSSVAAPNYWKKCNERGKYCPFQRGFDHKLEHVAHNNSTVRPSLILLPLS
jgi:hypothetical protein